MVFLVLLSITRPRSTKSYTHWYVKLDTWLLFGPSRRDTNPGRNTGTNRSNVSGIGGMMAIVSAPVNLIYCLEFSFCCRPCDGEHVYPSDRFPLTFLRLPVELLAQILPFAFLLYASILLKS